MIGIANVMIALQSCIGTVAGFFASPYTAWLPFVMIIALLVISVLAIVFVLSPLLGRNDIRAWVRVKIYETLLSIVLIMIFAAFATSICTFNPVPAFSSVGIVPPGCIGSGSSNLVQVKGAAVQVNTVYSLALCDMYNFRQMNINLNQYIFYAAIPLSIVGNIALSVEFIPGLAVVNPISPGIVNGVEGLGIGGAVGLVPVDTTVYLGSVFVFLGTVYLLNEIQLLLLGSSLLLFAILISIGLIARMFGVTRSFGGTMIALAIGLGFVYPLMTALTYGFIDYGIAQTPPPAVSAIFSIVFAAVEIFLAGGSGLTSFNGALSSFFSAGFIVYMGLVVAGLTVIPLLNFIVVDTFVVDFSQVIGERVDFLSLLERII